MLDEFCRGIHSQQLQEKENIELTIVHQVQKEVLLFVSSAQIRCTAFHDNKYRQDDDDGTFNQGQSELNEQIRDCDRPDEEVSLF